MGGVWGAEPGAALTRGGPHIDGGADLVLQPLTGDLEGLQRGDPAGAADHLSLLRPETWDKAQR